MREKRRGKNGAFGRNRREVTQTLCILWSQYRDAIQRSLSTKTMKALKKNIDHSHYYRDWPRITAIFKVFYVLLFKLFLNTKKKTRHNGIFDIIWKKICCPKYCHFNTKFKMISSPSFSNWICYPINYQIWTYYLWHRSSVMIKTGSTYGHIMLKHRFLYLHRS